MRAQLGTPGASVRTGDTTLELWWVKTLTGAGGGWQSVPEGSLVGAVRVSADYRDIRGRRIKPGVYTLRYALQPANGDHLGVSPYREFLLLSPASVDTAPAATGHQGAVDLSKLTTGASHPSVWSIEPPEPSGSPLDSYTNEAGHVGVIVEIAGALKVGLILIGKIEA